MVPKLHAVTYGADVNKPSVRYRFLNGVDRFRRDFEVSWAPTFDDPRIPLLGPQDILFIQKRIPSVWWSLVNSRRFPARIVYDFDDAIWTSALGDSFARRWRTELRVRTIVRRADLVIAANSYLGNWAEQAGARREIVPMAIEIPAITEQTQSEVTLFGWGGHPQSQYLLEAVSPVLARFFSSRKDCRLVVLSGKRPDLDFDFDWWPFDPDQEQRFFAKIDIGIVPSTRSTFDQGKSPIKILQHFSNGRPVITDGVGATRDLVTTARGWLVEDPEEWETALAEAAADLEGRQLRGSAARRYVEEHHSHLHVFDHLTKLMMELSEGKGGSSTADGIPR